MCLVPGESLAPHIKDQEYFCDRCGCSIVLHSANSIINDNGQPETICNECYKFRAMIDTTKIDNVVIEGIDMNDYPDFCDAFISSANYNGREMTSDELDHLNEDSDYVYDQVINSLF
jgi:hypothetical protein